MKFVVNNLIKILNIIFKIMLSLLNHSHIVPINTKVINHHVYRHTYTPMYTCSSEDVVSNVCEKSCGF